MAIAYDPDELETMVQDIVKRESKLTTWEHDFIVSIQTTMEAKVGLSLKQAAKVQDIWDRVTG